MIRNTLLIEIKKTIDGNANFSSNDFAISSEQGSLKIIYEYDASFYFHINIPSSISKLTRTEKETSHIGFMSTKHKDINYEAYEFSGEMKPGKISITEHLSFEHEHNLIKYINAWLGNLWSEINSQPELRRFQHIEEEVNKIKEKFNSISDDFFTSEEVQQIKERLSQLEENFKNKLEAEIQDKEILMHTLSDLHKEIEKLRGQSEILNKRSWFKSFGSKIFLWLSKEENRKFLKESRDFIKPLLPETVEKLL